METCLEINQQACPFIRKARVHTYKYNRAFHLLSRCLKFLTYPQVSNRRAGGNKQTEMNKQARSIKLAWWKKTEN